MRLIAIAALPLLALACAQGPRALDGQAEKGTAAILAITTKGETFQAKPAADGSFRLEVPSSHPVLVFAVRDNGVMQVMKFAQKTGGPRLATKIPNSEGTVHLGALSTCDCSGTGTTGETTPSADPADQTDIDGDGTPDSEDDDSDGDGIPDAEDSDTDGEAGDDATDDLDSDNDGIPDPCDSHDDSGDHQGDGEHHDGSGEGEHDGGDSGGDNGDSGGDNGDSGGDNGDSGGDSGGDNGGDDNGGDNNCDPGAGGEGEGEGEGEGAACVGELCPP